MTNSEYSECLLGATADKRNYNQRTGLSLNPPRFIWSTNGGARFTDQTSVIPPHIFQTVISSSLHLTNSIDRRWTDESNHFDDD